MDTQLLSMIDEALGRFAARDLVAACEVVDFLLDLRLVATTDPLREILDSQPEPAAV